MCARPAFRSRFRLARRVRMSLARLRASIRWVSDRSGAGPRSVAVSGFGRVWEAVGTGGIYTHVGASIGGHLDKISEIRLDLELRSRLTRDQSTRASPEVVATTGRSESIPRTATSSVRTRRPAAGSRKLSVPT